MPSPHMLIRIAVYALDEIDRLVKEYEDTELAQKIRKTPWALNIPHSSHRDQLLRDADALKDLKRDPKHRKALRWLRYEYEDDFGPIQPFETIEVDYGPKDYKDLTD